MDVCSMAKESFAVKRRPVRPGGSTVTERELVPAATGVPAAGDNQAPEPSLDNKTLEAEPAEINLRD